MQRLNSWIVVPGRLVSAASKRRSSRCGIGVLFVLVMSAGTILLSTHVTASPDSHRQASCTEAIVERIIPVIAQPGSTDSERLNAAMVVSRSGDVLDFTGKGVWHFDRQLTIRKSLTFKGGGEAEVSGIPAAGSTRLEFASVNGSSGRYRSIIFIQADQVRFEQMTIKQTASPSGDWAVRLFYRNSGTDTSFRNVTFHARPRFTYREGAVPILEGTWNTTWKHRDGAANRGMYQAYVVHLGRNLTGRSEHRGAEFEHCTFHINHNGIKSPIGQGGLHVHGCRFVGYFGSGNSSAAYNPGTDGNALHIEGHDFLVENCTFTANDPAGSEGLNRAALIQTRYAFGRSKSKPARLRGLIIEACGTRPSMSFTKVDVGSGLVVNKAFRQSNTGECILIHAKNNDAALCTVQAMEGKETILIDDVTGEHPSFSDEFRMRLFVQSGDAVGRWANVIRYVEETGRTILDSEITGLLVGDRCMVLGVPDNIVVEDNDITGWKIGETPDLRYKIAGGYQWLDGLNIIWRNNRIQRVAQGIVLAANVKNILHGVSVYGNRISDLQEFAPRSWWTLPSRFNAPAKMGISLLVCHNGQRQGGKADAPEPQSVGRPVAFYCVAVNNAGSHPSFWNQWRWPDRVDGDPFGVDFGAAEDYTLGCRYEVGSDD